MKICVVLPFHWGAARGGAEYQAHILSQSLANDSAHDVTFLARYTPDDDSGYSYRIQKFAGPACPGGLRWGRWIDCHALYTALDSIRPDVIIQRVASAYTGVVAFYARRHSAKMYWYISSDMDVAPTPNVGITGPARFIDRFFFRYGVVNADFVIAQTRSQTEMLQATFNRQATLKIGNFVAGPKFVATKSEQIDIVWIGNIKSLKRPDLFVDLARRFAGQPVRFRMAGRASESRAVEDMNAKRSGLDNLEYLGELSLEEVEEELDRAHLLVNTSDYEGFPNTFIQAWLREVPVFSLNVDPDGILAEYKIGCCCGSFDTLVGRIEEAIRHPGLLRAMGAVARVFALNHHSLRNLDTLRLHMADLQSDILDE